MSPTAPFVRHHKRQTDRAISSAFTRLASDSATREHFAALLHAVRERARRLPFAPRRCGLARVHAGAGGVNLACAVSYPGNAH